MSEERASSDRQIVASGTGGRALALIPVIVALLIGALMMPRSAAPEAIPVPMVDVREIARIERRDHELAEHARREQLPGEVRALGSAIRDFNTRQAQDADELALTEARTVLNKVRGPALAVGIDKLLELRALQAETFLEEVRRFEATGKESEELQALGGAFVRRMRSTGWCDANNTIVLDETQRRIAFKATWNAMVGLEAQPELSPTLDETRALYTLYIQHPHAPEPVRAQLASARRNAPDERTCNEIAGREAAAAEGWRLEKIRKLGPIDSSYPLAYALGVANFRRGQYPAAAESFRTWLNQHPNGPWSLRARNYLKASVEAAAY